MNIGLSRRNIQSRNTKPNRLSLARIYMKDGSIQNIPLRKSRPDFQFMNWFRHRSQAMSGFPVGIRSILWIDNQGLCPDCQERVRNYLGRFRLGNSFRIIQPNDHFGFDYPDDNCRCSHQASFREPAFDNYFNEEIKDYKTYQGYSIAGTKGTPLTSAQSTNARQNSKAQYYAKTKTSSSNPDERLNSQAANVNHRIPLEWVHQFKRLVTSPNKSNLQKLPVPVHDFVSDMWKQFKNSNTKKTNKNIEQYAKAVDEAMRAKTKPELVKAVSKISVIAPNVDVNQTVAGISTNTGRPKFWSSSFTGFFKDWAKNSKTFGKELELLFQELYAQEMGELAI